MLPEGRDFAPLLCCGISGFQPAVCYNTSIYYVSLSEELSVVNLTDHQALPKLEVASCLICCAIRKSTFFG